MARVTIVGGGYGGITVAKALDDVAQVTLIEQKDTFVNHAAALRAAVDEEWAERIFIPYDKLLTNGRVVHGTALTVRGTTVEVSGEGAIEADYLVLATGTNYPFPAKHLESSAVIAKARIERMRVNLAQAGRVLIVGAGAVGIELAGEITSAFPDIAVTLLETADRIIPEGDYKPEMRQAIIAQLQQRGVDIITGDKLSYLPPVDVGVLSPFRVETRGGRRIEADMWFRAYGSAAATGYLGTDYDEIRHYNGTIRVDEQLRVVDHPGGVGHRRHHRRARVQARRRRPCPRPRRGPEHRRPHRGQAAHRHLRPRHGDGGPAPGARGRCGPDPARRGARRRRPAGDQQDQGGGPLPGLRARRAGGRRGRHRVGRRAGRADGVTGAAGAGPVSRLDRCGRLHRCGTATTARLPGRRLLRRTGP